MNAPSLAPGYEVVHFVLGYYDGVLNGFADCGGSPHYFAQEPWGDELDGRYRLTPVSPEIFAAATESWDIWCRWARARPADEVVSHAGPNPALPEDEARRRELDELVARWLVTAEAQAFVMNGDFAQLLPGAQRGTDRGALQVRWTPG